MEVIPSFLSIYEPPNRWLRERERVLLPDEQCGGHQHHRQVNRHCRLEIEPLEECGGVADTNQEKRREEGRQQLIS